MDKCELNGRNPSVYNRVLNGVWHIKNCTHLSSMRRTCLQHGFCLTLLPVGQPPAAPTSIALSQASRPGSIWRDWIRINHMRSYNTNIHHASYITIFNNYTARCWSILFLCPVFLISFIFFMIFPCFLDISHIFSHSPCQVRCFWE